MCSSPFWTFTEIFMSTTIFDFENKEMTLPKPSGERLNL